ASLAGIEAPKFIEITDGMDPADKRKARIGNSKAKSAFNKALKAAGIDPKTVKIIDGKVVMPQGTAVPQAAGAAPVAAAPSVDLSGIEPPQLVELTDGMDPADKRKARIGNSKAKSAFNKALKAAGIDPKTVKIVNGKVVVPGAAPVAAAPVAAAAPSVDLAGIEAPQLVELTDDMDPADKRKARIGNSKAKSAFNKALKAAGIDPKTVKIVNGKVVVPGAVPTAAPAPAPQAAAPVAPAATGGAVDLAALGIERPQLTELTDDMAPADKRQARISNSKAKSAFNKALKAAGIDPKSI
ncbi:MAG: hypothetical protein KAG66_14470, partial [Methylococcales bacterium]|nr:hypothetical protein [Methylococcales bacterium]